jgi:hypothetical protein
MLMGVDVELLDQIDRLVKLCPCGAEPRDGSAYCSDDCVPNYRAAHTSSDTDGTQMRWRPDMVSEVDDSGLHDLGSNTFYDGRFNARLFQHDEPVDGAVTWHLRLDDGYRFVGANLTGVFDIDDELKRRVADKWAALERELTSSRHVESGVDPHTYFRNLAERINAAGDGDPWANVFPPSTPADDRIRVRLHTNPPSLLQAAEAVSRAAEAFRPLALGSAVRAVGDAMSRWAVTARREPSPEPEPHPMLAAIEARRTRNTGPERHQRPPRQLNPRH